MDISSYSSPTEVFTWTLTGGKSGGVTLRFISSALKHSTNGSILLPYTLDVTVDQPCITYSGEHYLNPYTVSMNNTYFESDRIGRYYFRDYVTRGSGVEQTTFDGGLCFKKKFSGPTGTGIEMRFDLKRGTKTSATASYSPVNNTVKRSGSCYVTVDELSSYESGYYSTFITVVLEEV